MTTSPRLRTPLAFGICALVLLGGSGVVNAAPPGKSPPSNTSLPTINGAAVVGSSLSGTPGTWSGPQVTLSYQWQRCASSSGACTGISNASGTTYTAAQADLGKFLRFSVNATNKKGTTPAVSAPTAAVGSPAPSDPTTAPTNTSLPQVSGVAAVAQTLTATTGTWSGSPTSYALQWKRCDGAGANCTDVSGATGSWYAVSSADVSSTLRASVVATNAGGSGSATSTTAGPVAAPISAPNNTVLPTVSGSAVVGQTLTSSTGSWSGTPTSYAYQWRRCDSSGTCNPIANATLQSYTLVTADVGTTLRSSVTASNAAGTTFAESAATAPVIISGTGPVTPGGRFGVATGWQLPWLSSTDRDRYLDSAAAMGADWTRIDINWTSIQAGGPTSYNWTPFDTVVSGLKVRGINTLGVIAYTPTWARAAGTNDKYPPTNNADYGNFCGATARHYAPMGVHTWEVWNEANLAGFFQPLPNPAKYTAMLKVCYTAIKAADPGATVLTAGSSPAGSYNNPGSSSNVNGINFLEGIYANGGQGYFDAVAHHPYSFPYAPSYAATWSAWYQMFGTTPSLRSVMTANGDAAKKIWATEWGLPTNGVAGDGHVTEAVQAAHVTEAFQLFGSYSWAGPLFVHNFRDDGTSTSTRENFFGLTRWDFSQKPSWTAFHTAATA